MIPEVYVVFCIQVFNFSASYFSSEHPNDVISCMETIMRLVIEESEDVQPQIASCLLQNVRKEDKVFLSEFFSHQRHRFTFIAWGKGWHGLIILILFLGIFFTFFWTCWEGNRRMPWKTEASLSAITKRHFLERIQPNRCISVWRGFRWQGRQQCWSFWEGHG